MPWLWWAAPLVFLVCLLLVSVMPTEEERRLRRSVGRWIDEMIGPLRRGGKVKGRRVKAPPPVFGPLLEEVGGGSRVADVVLVPKLAYLSARVSDPLTGSNHVTVLFRLDRKGPKLSCRPLPEVDGRPADNRGIAFTKHPELTEHVVVEAEGAKAARKWLKEPIRNALLERPDAWLRVRGDTAALTLYGHPDEDDIDSLVDVADAIFAAHGASEASLFGDEEPAPRGQPSEGDEEPAPPILRLGAGAVDAAILIAGVVAIALTVGAFESFHPSVLFQSPDIHPDEPWQGGWTTKGFGAFVAAETLLVGTTIWQLYLASHHGRTVGKLLLGAKVVREDRGPMDFWRLCLRSGIFAAVPLAVAAIVAGPELNPRTFFEAIPTLPVVGALALVSAAGAAFVLVRGADGRGLHDRWAGTKVVRTLPWRPPPLQLSVPEGQTDPILLERLRNVGSALVLFGVAAVLFYQMGLDEDWSRWLDSLDLSID